MSYHAHAIISKVHTIHVHGHRYIFVHGTCRCASNHFSAWFYILLNIAKVKHSCNAELYIQCDTENKINHDDKGSFYGCCWSVKWSRVFCDNRLTACLEWKAFKNWKVLCNLRKILSWEEISIRLCKQLYPFCHISILYIYHYHIFTFNILNYYFIIIIICISLWPKILNVRTPLNMLCWHCSRLVPDGEKKSYHLQRSVQTQSSGWRQLLL